jgi:hypothetical protein
MSHAKCAILIFLSILAGCRSRSSSPTLTFHESGCSYEGPDTLERSFVLEWIVSESRTSTSIIALVSVNPGKTVADLASMPAEDPPPAWVHKLDYGVAMSPGTHTKHIDLDANASYHGEPIYLVCFDAEEDFAIGAIGPFEIRE